MKSNWGRLALGAGALLLSMLACNWPGAAAPTPFVFPTPNETLTAVFQPTQVQAGLVTPATATQALLQLPTSTLLPSATVVPLTATSVPPTAAPAPTKTPVSYAGPGQRSGVSIRAPYIQREPTIDGVFDEWDVDRYGINNINYGGENWRGEDDLSGNVMVAWDDYNLYLAVRVKDDEYVQNAHDEELYKGDGIEVVIDTNVAADFYRQNANSDDYQLGLSPGEDEPGNDPEAYLWLPESEAGKRSKVKIGAVGTADGYRLEAQIPWTIFDVEPDKGQHFGFAISISDNDDRGKKQESVVASNPGRIYNDPSTWDDLTLVGAKSSSGSGSNSGSSGGSKLVRTSGSITAEYLDESPNLDGDLGEWDVDEVKLNKVAYGDNHLGGADDLSGTVMVGWDESNLYLAAHVIDDRYVQRMHDENIFLGDSLDIVLDAELGDDFSVRGLNGDDFQVGISPGEDEPGNDPEAYLWFPKGDEGPLPQVKIAAEKVSDGYHIEVRIPWSVFDIDPDDGDHYGFAVAFSDNDKSNQDVQQSMISNIGGRSLADPTTWGDLVLEK